MMDSVFEGVSYLTVEHFNSSYMGIEIRLQDSLDIFFTYNAGSTVYPYIQKYHS